VYYLFSLLAHLIPNLQYQLSARMAPDPPPGTRNNPIHIDDECHESAGRETYPGMTALPTMPEGPTHGLPLDLSRDDDQEIVATEVAASPPSLTEDMAEANPDVQLPDIGQAQDEENTAPGIPPGMFDL
jgi:hypothetical protein